MSVNVGNNLVTGQVALSGTATPLTTDRSVQFGAWSMKVPSTSTQRVYIGEAGITSSTGHIVEPGEVVEYGEQNIAGQIVYDLQPYDVYVIGTSPDVVSWAGSRLQ